MFTHQEIDIAKQVRATVLKENVDELKATNPIGHAPIFKRVLDFSNGLSATCITPNTPVFNSG